jgi:hypothetical protein
MDLKEKIIKALRSLRPEFALLDDDDGISGFVVSRVFEGMPGLERQEAIGEALEHASLTPEEQRCILMVAGLTPEEYEEVGARIRVYGVKELARGDIEVRLHGGLSDANYVRTVLGEAGAQTTAPKPVKEAAGILMSFRAKRSGANPLTKEKAIRALSGDKQIMVMAQA